MPDDDPFDPARLALPDDWKPSPVTIGRRQLSAPKRGRFLKGPVSWPWLLQAMRLPGKALALALMLWRESGCVRSRTVHFCLKRAVQDGIPRRTASRAMQLLERAGLVTVRRQLGHGLEVTLNVKDED